MPLCAQNSGSGLLWCCQCALKACSSLLQCRQCIQRVCSSLLFKTIQKCWSRLHCALSHCTLLCFATCMDMHGFTRVYIYIYRRLGGETNREIDFGFGSVVRARGLVVRWECAQNLIPAVAFPFPFWPRELFPFPLEIHPPPQPSIQLQLALSVFPSYTL